MPPKKERSELDELKSLIQQNHKELTETLNKKFDLLNTWLTKVESTANLALETATKNANLLEEQNRTEEFQNKKLEEKISHQTKCIETLENQLNEQTDRSLRTTLIFRGIPQKEDEKSWSNTTTTLANTLNKICPNDNVEEIIDTIERAHRAKKSENTGKNNTSRPIIAKFSNWKFSEKFKSAIIKYNRNQPEHPLYVSQMYSTKTTDRINDALKHRKELARQDSNLKMFVAYPATLMGRALNDQHYKVLQKF